MILVFDLDDTLYDEKSYMRSGFMAVSRFLSERLSLTPSHIFNQLLMIERQHGRGFVFDFFLQSMGVYNKHLVLKCISTYRLHSPQISLNPDAVACLKKFSGLPLYIVTDGNKVVQQKKIAALGIRRFVKGVYVTHQYGIEKSKPSAFCFFKIALKENSKVDEIFYIGDNPKKDFIGIKPYGFKTIRILQGMFKDVEADEAQRAHYEIKSLDELNHSLLKSLLL